MANIVFFQGVEVTLPVDVAFAHKEGCLEIDLTGLAGKLRLRPAPGAEQAALRQGLSTARIPPLQRLLSDSTLVKDSPEPPVSQGWKNLPATWLTASPVGSRHPEQREEAAVDPEVDTSLDAQLTAAEQLQPLSMSERGRLYSAADNEEAQPDIEHTVAAEVRDKIKNSAAATPAVEQSIGMTANVPTAAPNARSGLTRPESSADADKENDVTDLRTPVPASAKELKSTKKEKRSCEGAPKSGSASSKRQKALAAAATPPKELAGRWRPMEYPKGSSEETCPCSRWGSSFTVLSATQVQGCLYGGQNTEGHLGDAWLFNSESMTWQQTATSDFGGFSDAAKAWHAAAVLKCADGDKLVVYGGEKGAAEKADRPEAQADDREDDDDEDSEPISDVCQLCPQSHYWVILPMEGERNSRLPARTGSTMTAMPDGRGLVFGGLDLEGKFRNDAFIVDPRSCRWFGLGGIIKNAPPKPRAYHTATLVGNRVIVMGGLGSRLWSCKEVYSLQLDSWKWTEHTSEVEGESPAPRSGHAAVALPDGRHLALFGGGDADKDLFYANLAILDTLTWRWSAPKLQSIARPSGRAGHSMALLRVPGGKDVLVVHGGRTKDNRLCKDTWLLELAS